MAKDKVVTMMWQRALLRIRMLFSVPKKAPKKQSRSHESSAFFLSLPVFWALPGWVLCRSGQVVHVVTHFLMKFLFARAILEKMFTSVETDFSTICKHLQGLKAAFPELHHLNGTSLVFGVSSAACRALSLLYLVSSLPSTSQKKKHAPTSC